MSRRRVITYGVEPQQPSPRGWTLCLPHQAHRFAVVQITHWKQGRTPMRVARVIASFDVARGQAEAHANSLMATYVSHAKGKPKASLGNRFTATGRAIIARSLTSSEYHASREPDARADAPDTNRVGEK